jgi:hypothetical protein
VLITASFCLKKEQENIQRIQVFVAEWKVFSKVKAIEKVGSNSASQSIVEVGTCAKYRTTVYVFCPELNGFGPDLAAQPSHVTGRTHGVRL